MVVRNYENCREELNLEYFSDIVKDTGHISKKIITISILVFIILEALENNV